LYASSRYLALAFVLSKDFYAFNVHLCLNTRLNIWLSLRMIFLRFNYV